MTTIIEDEEEFEDSVFEVFVDCNVKNGTPDGIYKVITSSVSFVVKRYVHGKINTSMTIYGTFMLITTYDNDIKIKKRVMGTTIINNLGSTSYDDSNVDDVYKSYPSLKKINDEKFRNMCSVNKPQVYSVQLKDKVTKCIVYIHDEIRVSDDSRKIYTSRPYPGRNNDDYEIVDTNTINDMLSIYGEVRTIRYDQYTVYFRSGVDDKWYFAFATYNEYGILTMNELEEDW